MEVFENFTKTFKITEVKKTNIKGYFENLHVGDTIKIQVWPGDKRLKITVCREGLDKREFFGYAGNIQKSLWNFELEELNGI